MGIKVRVKNTELKEDHVLPFYLSGYCSSCYHMLKRLQVRGVIPEDRNLCTVFVSEDNDFAYKCVNSKCEERSNFYTLSCMLKHRDFKTVSMDIELQNELWVDDEGAPDLDNPEMENYISLHYGPMKDCPGHLDWTQERNLDTGATKLVCSYCEAVYNTFVFSTYNRMQRKINQRHSEFEVIPQRDSDREHPAYVRKKSFSAEPLPSLPVPVDWCLAVDEIEFQGTKFSFWRNMR